MKMILFTLVALPMLAACTPKIYVIDRQTVLEQEAAGQWPQFEKEIVQKSKKMGAEPLSKVPTNASRERLYRVLNGEMASTAQAGTSK